MATYEERAQAIMATLRENNVTRTLPDTRTGRLVNTPFDDNDLHGLAMQVLFADAVVRQAPTEPAVRAFNGYTVEQVSLAMDFLEAIVAERKRAHEKHGATSMEQSGLLEHRRASILAEEAVECGKALNDNEHGDVDLAPGIIPPDWTSKYDELDKELIQTAAMAYTWWANRRGDRLPSPAPEPKCAWTHEGRTCGMPRIAHGAVGHAFAESAPERPTIPVLINGISYTGVLDPATGTLHVHTIDGPFGKALHDAQAGDPVAVRLVDDLQLHEVSFVAGPPDSSKGIHPILSVGPPRAEPAPPADASWVTFEDHRGRRTDYQGNPIPPLTDDEGGRRGD